jgi:hypothetical protein
MFLLMVFWLRSEILGAPIRINKLDVLYSGGGVVSRDDSIERRHGFPIRAGHGGRGAETKCGDKFFHFVSSFCEAHGLHNGGPLKPARRPDAFRRARPRG